MSKKFLSLSEIIIRKLWAKNAKEAEALALSGRIRSKQGKVFDKPGMSVSMPEELELEPAARFVSRGGDKMESAIEHFCFRPAGYVCVDIGSSTGGFADCMMQHGAKKVYCVDVAYGKLDWKLRNDPRVENKEKTNFQSLKHGDFPEPVDAVSIDISFSSCRRAFTKACELLKHGGEIMLLFKPQFEVEARYLDKGVLNNRSVLTKALNDFESYVKEHDIKLIGYTESAVKGRKGNQEYFFFMKKK